MIKHTRFNIGLLTLLALAYSPFRKKAKGLPKKIKKVMGIYLTRNLGDMIFTTPVIRALKAEMPECHLSMIGRPRNAETLMFNPDLDEYIPYPESIFKLWKKIRSEKPDYVFLFMPTALDIATLLLAGVPAIGVFVRSNKKTETETITNRILRRFCIQIPFESGSNFAVENLKLLNPLGIYSKDVRKHLYFSTKAKETIGGFISGQLSHSKKDMVIALAPGAGTKIKQWPAERFAKVADYICEEYDVPVFVVGGPGDVAEYQHMSESIKSNTKIVSCLHHSIDELKAFGSKVNLMIANDSAPIYVAEAFGKATVTIVGPTNENEHPPKGRCNRVVINSDRGAPALAAGSISRGQVDERSARRQIEDIRTEQVIEAVDELIQDTSCIMGATFPKNN